MNEIRHFLNLLWLKSIELAHADILEREHLILYRCNNSDFKLSNIFLLQLCSFSNKIKLGFSSIDVNTIGQTEIWIIHMCFSKEWERERESVCERECVRESVCVCLWQREREREVIGNRNESKFYWGQMCFYLKKISLGVLYVRLCFYAKKFRSEKLRIQFILVSVQNVLLDF